MVNELAIAKYIRLSSEDLDVDGGQKEESVSVTAQRQLISAFISEHTEFNGLLVKEFVDDGFSGTNFDRPAFQRMMEEAKQGRFSIIIVKDLSRFGRDHLGVGNYLERILPILQIRLIAINDGYDSAGLDGMTGGMSVALHNIINAMYSRDLSSKVKSAQRTRAERGEYIASMPTFGYIKDPQDKHHLIIDDEAAEIVRLVFELVASGKKKGEIIAYLNSNGIKTPAEYKAEHGIRKLSASYTGIRMWDNASINYIVRNECYIGVTVWNKSGAQRPGSRKQIKKDQSEWIRVEGTHEPIVTKELFDKANAEIAKNHRNRGEVRKPVTRKPLFICPYCNHALRMTTKKKSYVCREAARSGIDGCKTVHADRQKLEDTIAELVNTMLALVDEPKGGKDRKSGKYQNRVIIQNRMELQENVVTLAEHGDSFMAGRSVSENGRYDMEKISICLKQIEQERIRVKSEKLKIHTDYRSDRLSKDEYLSAYEKIVGRLSVLDKETDALKDMQELLEKEQTGRKEEVERLKQAACIKEFDKAKLLTVIDRVLVYDNEHIEVKWKCRDWNSQEIKAVSD